MENLNKIQEFFSKSLEEMDFNDPVLVQMRANKIKVDQSKPDFGKEYGDAVKKAYSGNNNDTKLRFLKKEREQLMRDMEQEAEPEGGPIADEYGSKLNRIDKAIAKLKGRKEMTYDQAIAEEMEANEFLDTINDEFDIETLELMKGAIAKRILFLQKMVDTANPRAVVRGFMKELKETNPGLWANIRAKRSRGEKPSPKGSKAYKAAVKSGNKINREQS